MPRYRSPAVIAADLAYRKANREKINARVLAWSKANPDLVRERTRRYRLANKEKIRDQKREWRKRNPEKHNAANARWKMNRMMRICDYKALLEKQGGACAICRSTNSGQRQTRRLSIDHCHSSGKVRGLLCHKCNSMLGLAKDNQQTLAAAIDYLKVNCPQEQSQPSSS